MILEQVSISEITTIFSLFIAFLAVFVSPLINSRISKREILASVKQDWANTFKDKLSESLAIMSINRWNYSTSSNFSDERNERVEKQGLERYEKLIHIISSIKLHIDLTQPNQVALVNLLENAANEYHDESVVSKKMQHDILELGHKILKNEWNNIKKY